MLKDNSEFSYSVLKYIASEGTACRFKRRQHVPYVGSDGSDDVSSDVVQFDVQSQLVGSARHHSHLQRRINEPPALFVDSSASKKYILIN